MQHWATIIIINIAPYCTLHLCLNSEVNLTWVLLLQAIKVYMNLIWWYLCSTFNLLGQSLVLLGPNVGIRQIFKMCVCTVCTRLGIFHTNSQKHESVCRRGLSSPGQQRWWPLWKLAERSEPQFAHRLSKHTQSSVAKETSRGRMLCRYYRAETNNTG